MGAADRNDEFYPSSYPIVDAVRTGQLPFALTTDFVVSEAVTLLGRRKGFGAQNAKTVGMGIITSPRVFVVYIDEDFLKEALNTYPQYKGRLSLTDVASTIVMRRYGVREIYSHDSDFDLVSGVKRRETL